MLRSIGKQSGESWSQSEEEKRQWWEGFAQKQGFFSLKWKSEGVIDDESGGH